MTALEDLSACAVVRTRDHTHLNVNRRKLNELAAASWGPKKQDAIGLLRLTSVVKAAQPFPRGRK
jgi:hypothetical protein